MFLSI